MKWANVWLCLAAIAFLPQASAASWRQELGRGIELERAERLNEAALAYARAEKASSRPETIRPLVFVLHRLGRYSLCQEYAGRWAALEPGNVDPHQALGECAQAAGDHAAAVAAFRRVVSQRDEPERQLWLSHACHDLGDYGCAKDALVSAMARFPEPRRRELGDLLGRIELALGNYAEAGRLLGERPMLGVTHVPADGGWQVVVVQKNGPAERADIRVNDLITHFNGQPLRPEGQGLAPLVAGQPAGATVEITLRREGRTLLRPVVLSLAPPDVGTPDSAHVAGDDAYAEARLRIHGVTVVPGKVVAGEAFRALIDLSAEGRSTETSLSVIVQLAVTRDGRTLTETRWTAQVPARQRARIIKDIPRAAGEPGPYGIEVRITHETGIADGLARFEIVEATGRPH